MRGDFGIHAAMSGPRYTPLVASLPATVPFVGPEALERRMGRPFAARLGANESVFGPSPRAIDTMERAAREAWMYADPESHDLKAALAAHHGVTPGHIVVGEGIDGLLGYLVRLTVGLGDAVVTSAGAYPTFNYHVEGFGGRLHRVPYRDDREDPEALLAAARDASPKLVYLANPDNPMGSLNPAAQIERMVAAMPAGSLLVLDEAYGDFAPELPRIDADDPRVIRMRTFSKAYGLAGARVGYAIAAPGLIAAFDKVRNHFGLSRISQQGALAALEDQDWLRHVVAEVAASRSRIAEIGAAHGLAALPSATNFVALDTGGDGALSLRLVEALAAEGIFVRRPFVAPQDRCIRISCGRAEDLDRLAAALGPALARARAALTAA